MNLPTIFRNRHIARVVKAADLLRKVGRQAERRKKRKTTFQRISALVRRQGVNPQVSFKKFQDYRPCFTTSIGFVHAKLQKTGFSKVNGEPVAYYVLEYFDLNAGRHKRSCYLYAIRRGKPTQIQQLD